MSNSRKVQGTHTSLRLAPDVAANLATAAGLTGWSIARTVCHVVKIGFAASARNSAALEELVTAFQGAMKVHAVELENARRLAAARKEHAPARRPPHPTKDASKVAAIATRAAKRAGKRKAAAAAPPSAPAPAGSAA